MLKTPIHLTEHIVFTNEDSRFKEYSIRDADWQDQNGLALAISIKGRSWIVINSEWIPSPIKDDSPFIRWIDQDRILLVQRRSGRFEKNVFILNLSGEITGSFHAGDAIEDVVAGPEGIWISYYYGGFRKGLPNEKLVLFGMNGLPIFRYESDLPEKPDILEILTLVKGKESAIWLVPLLKPLVEIVPEETSLALYEHPNLLKSGTSAVCIRGDFVYFVLEDTKWCYACRIGEETAQPIGKIKGESRGLAPTESYHFIAFSNVWGEVRLFHIDNKEENFLV
ncbi:hypothetical protein [Planococcus sp. CAU13]|uniref:hypothetical protein n=1 Tax=Planococcus sp. CAU13 TaxID=1541197 RepID=UPI00052FE5B9|nr:hypothetical protein [Planococcus sp. CAU13]